MKQNDSESQSVSAAEPYAIPEGWKWTRLGDFFTHTTGKALKKENTVGSLKKYITTSNIYWNYFDFSDVREMYFADSELEKCTATKGDLLICNGGDVGRGAIWNFDYDICLQNHVSRLRKKTNNVSTEYFYYIFKFYKDSGLINGKGIGISSLSAKAINELIVPLPPTLAEQKRIVSRIESMFTKLDEARDKAQSVVDGFELRRAAILHKAFTNQLKIENGKLKDEDWEERLFSELGTANLGKMLDAKKNEGDEVQYLRNVNVRWFDFDLSDLMTMKAKPDEIKKLSVKKGDLFICEGGEPGRCAVWKNEDANMIFQKAIHRFRPNENVSSDFIAYALSYLNQIGKLSEYFTGTTIKHLTGQSLAKIPIRIPPLNFQLSIVNFLDSVLEKDRTAKEAAEQVLEQIDLLKKSILARAFRGEL